MTKNCKFHIYIQHLSLCFSAYLVLYLEVNSCNLGFDNKFVFETLQEIGVKLPKLLEIYDRLFKSKVSTALLWIFINVILSLVYRYWLFWSKDWNILWKLGLYHGYWNSVTCNIAIHYCVTVLYLQWKYRAIMWPTRGRIKSTSTHLWWVKMPPGWVKNSFIYICNI